MPGKALPSPRTWGLQMVQNLMHGGWTTEHLHAAMLTPGGKGWDDVAKGGSVEISLVMPQYKLLSGRQPAASARLGPKAAATAGKVWSWGCALRSSAWCSRN